MIKNTVNTWGAVAKLLHWTMALLIFVQIGLGWVAVGWKLSPTKLSLFVWHKSIGMLLLVLVVLRLSWRLLNPTPALPGDMLRWERTAARTSHALLYALMIAMPLSGWVINSAANIPFRVFWWFPLPAIVTPDKALAALAKIIHLSLFIALATVIVLHVAAAWRHHAVKRNNLLRRMLPGRSRPRHEKRRTSVASRASASAFTGRSCASCARGIGTSLYGTLGHFAQRWMKR